MKTPALLLLALSTGLLLTACDSQNQPAEEATATPGVSPATPGEPLRSEADTTAAPSSRP